MRKDEREIIGRLFDALTQISDPADTRQKLLAILDQNLHAPHPKKVGISKRKMKLLDGLRPMITKGISNLDEWESLIAKYEAADLPATPVPEIAGENRGASDRDHALSAGLTRRQADIFLFLAKGANHREIAAELSVSINTVNAHVQNIFGKLNVTNRIEAVNAVRSVDAQ
jgi:DNA-binding CsgD family transcriptional regulator